MKAIVTGSSGFVGTHLVPALMHRGLDVVGIDRVQPQASYPQEFLQCDLRELRTTSHYNGSFHPDDVVFHLAAAKGDWGLSESEYHEDNVNATRALLSACARTGVMKHVFFSTVAVYGPAEFQKDEACPCAPATAYGRSKVAAEHLYEEWIREHPGANVTILRPSAIFGPNQPASTNIYRLVEAIRKKRFLMVGDGMALKSTSYIDNTVAAAEFILDNLMVGHTDFIYVDEPVATNREFVRLICDSLQTPQPTLSVPLAVAWPIASISDLLGGLIKIDFPITAARIKKFCTSTNFSSRKLRDAGFIPPVSMDTAIRRTVHWHVECV